MNTPVRERLETMRRVLREQDAAWRRACEALGRLGDVRLLVPHEALEQLEAPVAAPAAAPLVQGVRA